MPFPCQPIWTKKGLPKRGQQKGPAEPALWGSREESLFRRRGHGRIGLRAAILRKGRDALRGRAVGCRGSCRSRAVRRDRLLAGRRRRALGGGGIGTAVAACGNTQQGQSGKRGKNELLHIFVSLQTPPPLQAVVNVMPKSAICFITLRFVL